MRPHLQNIDNVPLLVPLFTDCTPESEYCGHGDSGSLASSTERCRGLGMPWALEGMLVSHAGSKGTWEVLGGLVGWSCGCVHFREEVSHNWVGWSQRGAHFPLSPVLWVSAPCPTWGPTFLTLCPRLCPLSHV